LHAAFDAGIAHFDTSPLYGFGTAEVDLGAAFSKRRNRVTLTTKIGLYPPGGPPHLWNAWLRKGLGKVLPTLNIPQISWDVKTAELSLTGSLKRCRTEYFDLVLLHEPSWESAQTDELLDWLRHEQRRGRIRYWGLGGVRSAVEPWVNQQHPLANVVQTKDTLGACEADFLPKSDRRLQLTYGYLSGDSTNQPMAHILKAALARNQGGSVIVSTRRRSRIAEIVAAAEQ